MSGDGQTKIAPFEKKFVYKTTLKKVYGLTDVLVTMLGDPDKTVENPHYRRAAPACLYAIERVEAWIDAHPVAVARARKARAARSSAAKAAADRRREETLAWARGVPIVVADLPDDLVARAQHHYDERIAARNYLRSDEEGWSEPRDVGFLGVLAHARHNYTNYEALLVAIERRVGGADAYPILKDRANDALRDVVADIWHAKVTA